MRMLRSYRVGPACLSLALFVWHTGALADEPRKPAEPFVLNEPGEITDVIDAFDDGDPFDLHFTLGYQYTWKGAHIRRETYVGGAANPQLSTGGFTAGNMDVASYAESTSRLNTKLEVGLYKDIAFIVRMPVVLSNDRKLDDLNGSVAGQRITLIGANPGEQVFSLPFKAPQRSGIEYLAVGVDFGLMNQMRDETKPTWLFGIEGRFSVSEPMHACNANPPAGEVRCAHFSDENRDGVQNGNEGAFKNKDDPGISRGTTGLDLHSYISRRVKYVEPYAGFKTLFEFQNSSSDYGATDLKGSLVNHPPLEGWVLTGIQIIPWEQKEEFQRVTFDLRASAGYRSEGREYSELFDALGSSDAPSLRQPNYGAYRDSGRTDPATGLAISEVDPASQKVYLTGITDVQPYAMFQALGSILWQAGEYIKFQVGGSWSFQASHGITNDQSCNPDFKDNPAVSGPCRSITQTGPNTYSSGLTGIPNPNYRPTINQVGRRFRVDDTNTWEAWVNGIVMF